ncbi:FAR1-related sequence 6, partial [Striga asiatica]
CSSAGFKKKTKASNPRPETRTGCPAMVIIKLVDALRWRIIDVELSHNHPMMSPDIIRLYKSHKRIEKAQQCVTVKEVHTIRLYTTAVSDAMFYDHALKISEFEKLWGEMINQHGLGGNKWLQLLYEDRQRWGPVYLKDTSFVGMLPINGTEGPRTFFNGYVQKHTSFKECLDKYDLALQRNQMKEALEDYESRNSNFELKTKSKFELQLSKVYTRKMFKKCQIEVEGMCLCFNTKRATNNGPVTTFVVEERIETGGNEKEVRHYYEVLFESTRAEVRCICGLFNFKGYLCRHALTVLNYNGVEEIPAQYILPRWNRDYKLNFLLDIGFSDADGDNSMLRYNHLFRQALQVLEEGTQSLQQYEAVMQELDTLLTRFSLGDADFGRI